MTTRPLFVGIDLGTTNSLVAAWDGDAPQLVPNALGEVLTPSAVAFDGQSMLVGKAALARRSRFPGATFTSFKRDMGTDRKFELGTRRLTAPELSAAVLTALREDAEAKFGRKIDGAVITVPAYFDEEQRKATMEAGAIAGLNVRRLINEPTAAALAYGIQNLDREARIVVVDLGGGTFDVTVMELIEGVMEIRATAGDTRLGGDDFADAIAEHVLRRAGLDPLLVRASPTAWVRVWEAAEAAKRALTDKASAAVSLHGLVLADGWTGDLEVVVSRAAIEELWAPLLGRLREPMRRALGDAGLRPSDVDEVLLVGGATRIPAVRTAVSEWLPGVQAPIVPPDEAVALGAAVQAALVAKDAALKEVVVTDIAPLSLGIEVSGRTGRRRMDGLFAPILERGTVLPASRVAPFWTVEDGQTAIRVRVFQGEHSLADQNLLLGEINVDGLPPRAAGMEGIDVRFTYDLDGLLEVECTVRATGRKAVGVFSRGRGTLSEAEIKEARARLEAYKRDPRDLLPNRVALEKAESAFMESRGDRREAVGIALASFRAALQAQNEFEIRRERERLLALVEFVRLPD